VLRALLERALLAGEVALGLQKYKEEAMSAQLALHTYVGPVMIMIVYALILEQAIGNVDVEDSTYIVLMAIPVVVYFLFWNPHFGISPAKYLSFDGFSFVFRLIGLWAVGILTIMFGPDTEPRPAPHY
jgi:hypothetical protein